MKLHTFFAALIAALCCAANFVVRCTAFLRLLRESVPLPRTVSYHKSMLVHL